MVAAEAVGAECPPYPSSGVLMGYRELQVMESQRIGISGAPALGTQWGTDRQRRWGAVEGVEGRPSSASEHRLYNGTVEVLGSRGSSQGESVF